MATATLSKQQWPFSPQCINNCIFWLDAADQSSYTPGASITSFRNKGYGAGSTTVTGTIGSTTAEINGIPALAFSAASFTLGPTMTYTQTTRTAFLVVNIGASGSTRNFMIGGANSIDTQLVSVNTDLELSYNAHINYSTTSPYPIFNTTSIICGTTLSTNPGIFVNGLAQTLASGNTPLAYTTGATTQQQIGNNATATFVLGEAMIFDGAITDIQRQQVEGYLAQKWGLQSLLPVTHPYFTLNNLITYAFEPTQIPTCALWLDASDATSITGTGVATWKDKSGNGYNLTGVNSPVFVKSTGGVSFTAASSQYFTMSVPYSKTNTIFMVATPVPSNASGMYYTNTSATNAGDNFIGGFSSSYLVYYIGTNSVQQTSYVSDVPTSPFIAAAVKTTGVSSVGYYNGAQVFSIADNTSDVASTWAYLGGSGVGNYLTATVYEFIIYNVALTANQVQAVNAYLGAKWNVAEAGQGSIAPVVNPLAIAGCQLWLDGADATTIVPIVSTWRDNSGLGNNMSLTAGTVTYVSNPGPPCVNFASGGILQTSTYTTITASQSIIFVVCQATAVIGGSFGYVFACSDINGGDSSIRFYPNTTTLDNGFSGTTFYVNGVSYTSGTNSLTTGYNLIDTIPTGQSGTTRFSLSSSFNGRYFIGNIREVIVYTGPLTTTQRLQVENYLMAKWGTGRNFWIDASDATTVTKATNVVSWLDKSGNGNHATVVTGNPTLTKNALNGLSVLTFGGATNLNSPLSMPTTSPLTYFCVAKPATGGFISVSAINGGGGNYRPNTLMMYEASTGYWWFSGGTGGTDGNTITLATSTSRYDINANYWSPNYTQVNINGTSYASSTGAPASLTAGGTFLVGRASGPAIEYWNGTIAEIIVYNTTLTTTQRQQVETYLANKWALTVATSIPGITNPTLIPGCVLWLDAADPTAVVTGVSQMNDKSGNGYNITQATATYQPTLTNNYLILGTSYNSYMNMPQAAINNTSSWTLFLVFNPSSSTNWIMAKQFDGTNSYNMLSMTNYTSSAGANTTGTTGVLYFRPYNAGTLFTGPAALTTSTNQLLTLICNGTNIYYYLNGVLAAITNGTFTIQNQTGATNATLGAWISSGSLVNSGVTNFQLGEMSFYNSALTTIQIQEIAASLMNKWTITNTVETATGSLADTPFFPTDITGCALWLDAADTSSITMTGSAITSWADKSGNGRNATAFNSPTYSASGLGVVMNGTSNYFTSTTTVPTATHCLIAVHSPTTISGSNTGNTSLFRFQVSNYVVFPYMNGTTPRGYISNQDSTTTAYTTSVLVENSVANTRNVIAANISATSQTIYKNGVIQSTGAASMTNITSDSLTIGTLATEYYSGTIYEMIVYNTTLTTAQIAQVNTYLQNKWNVAQTVITIPTPVYNRPFQPVDIAGCQLWLDSADNTALALSGSNVTTWYDKSGNGNNGTATGTPVLTANSINGRQSIYLADAPYFLGSVSITTTTLTCFAVATTNLTLPNGRGRDQRLVSLANTTNVDYGRTDGTIALFNQQTTGNIITWRVSGPLASNAITTGTPFLAVSQYTGASAFLWYTGAAGTLASSASSGSFGITKYGIGNQANPTTEYWNGYIGEVIIYNSALSTSQRQQVEAYLSWKWGFVTGTPSLPSTHPGKTLPSFSTIFTPKSITGLAMWFDAADNSTITLSGSLVTQWNDKSGNGYNATNSTYVSPTYSATGFNTKYPGLLFNGTSTMLATPSILPTPVLSANGTDTTIFLVFNRLTGTGNYVAFGLGGAAVATNYNTYVLRDPWSTGNSILDIGNGASGRVSIANTANGPQIYSLWRSGTSTYFYNYGASIGSNLSSSSNVGTTNQPLNIGGGFADSGWYNSYISEFIIYNYALSTSQRQQVEGYLGWKWGLASSLPTTHPFKKFSP